jgi:hypothetical protein
VKETTGPEVVPNLTTATHSSEDAGRKYGERTKLKTKKREESISKKA